MPDRDCLKLTSYTGERRQAGGKSATDALLRLSGKQDVAASVVLRGIQGFGHRHRLRTDRSLTLSEDLPLVTVAMDIQSRLESVLEPAADLVAPGLLTVERARLLDADAGQHGLLAGPAEDEARLTVFFTSHDQVFSIPAFEAICDLLRRRGVSSAMAMMGVDGIVGGRRLHASFLGRHAELPMIIQAIGPADRLLQAIPEVGGLLRNPLMTVEPVRTCKRDGMFMAVPDRSAGTDEYGLPRWHKLCVYAPETAQHDGQALHRVLIQRLLAADVSGATTLRGIRGFHGDGSPTARDARRLGRGRPVVTIVMDAPERIGAAFAIIDEVTASRGLVTSEVISATQATADLPRSHS